MWRLLGLAFLCVAKKPAFKPLVKAEGLEKDEFQCARCKWTAKVLRSALGQFSGVKAGFTFGPCWANGS
ncbi:unnamed protein product [Effrenium voratum]|nr:unnamed protein product [Effrenium voratum]